MIPSEFDKERLIALITSKTEGNAEQLKEFAKLIGVHPDTLKKNWMKGEIPEAFDLFIKLHRALLLPISSPLIKGKSN